MNHTTWLNSLKRDLLDPYRRLAVLHPFYRKMADGGLSKGLVRRYVSDTLWAVRDFADIALSLAERAPKTHQEFLNQIAGEEIGHPALLAKAVDALGGDSQAILTTGTRYRPTPIYELWWHRVSFFANYMPWVEAVAAVMVGIEDLARVQEHIVGKALVEHYGLSTEQSAWFNLHGGEEEEEHGGLGLSILGELVSADNSDEQMRIRNLIQRVADILLFHYPDELLRVTLSDEPQAISPALVHIESLGINYQLVEHPPGIRSASEFAEATGINPERVFKTLLLKSKNSQYLLCSLPCTQQIDMNNLTVLSGFKGLSLAPRSEVSAITGFNSIMVSPFGLLNPLPYYVDDQLFNDLTVYLGMGMPGADVRVSVTEVLNTLRPICGMFTAERAAGQ